MVRSDGHSDCSSALHGALTVTGEDDYGGLVYDAGGGRLRVNVRLHGDVDGMVCSEYAMNPPHPTPS